MLFVQLVQLQSGEPSAYVAAVVEEVVVLEFITEEAYWYVVQLVLPLELEEDDELEEEELEEEDDELEEVHVYASGTHSPYPPVEHLANPTAAPKE